MLKFIQDVFTDQFGGASSKRIATFVVLILIIAIVIAVQFLGKALNERIWDDLINTFWIGLGLISSERLMVKKDSTQPVATDDK